jgi:hypothetical protein
MGEDSYRRLDRLIAEEADLALLTAELQCHPSEQRADLCRYAWGLLDCGYDSDEEAALWLYAWLLAQHEERGIALDGPLASA